MTPFEDILSKSLEIHKKKRADYTTNPNTNPYENFDRANEIIKWFPDRYKSYASHIGTKLARLGSLLQSGRTPNNESIDDSFLDLITYCGLMYSEYKRADVSVTFDFPPSFPRKSSDGPDPTEPPEQSKFNPTLKSLPSCIHKELDKTGRCINCNTLMSDHAIAKQYHHYITTGVYKLR